MALYYREDSYLDELIQQKFTTALMSNSKWVKLLAALVDNWFEIKECLVKPIWDDKTPFRHLLLDENTRYNFDYYASATESMISGKPRGWYAYKEIEWLDFPSVVTAKIGAKETMQDLALINKIIDNSGQYSVELTPNNLRLYAYFR